MHRLRRLRSGAESSANASDDSAIPVESSMAVALTDRPSTSSSFWARPPKGPAITGPTWTFTMRRGSQPFSANQRSISSLSCNKATTALLIDAGRKIINAASPMNFTTRPPAPSTQSLTRS